jgi:hypothetical protein
MGMDRVYLCGQVRRIGAQKCRGVQRQQSDSDEGAKRRLCSGNHPRWKTFFLGLVAAVDAWDKLISFRTYPQSSLVKTYLCQVVMGYRWRVSITVFKGPILGINLGTAY